MSLANRCYLCKNNMESVLHLSFLCPFATAAFWSWILQVAGWGMRLPFLPQWFGTWCPTVMISWQSKVFLLFFLQPFLLSWRVEMISSSEIPKRPGRRLRSTWQSSSHPLSGNSINLFLVGLSLSFTIFCQLQRFANPEVWCSFFFLILLYRSLFGCYFGGS